MSADDPCERIWAVVGKIPRGRVATYGQVAAEAGLPRRARLVGRALNLAPAGLKLPWHRVIAAPGRIAFPGGSQAFLAQEKRLAAEGVDVLKGRIALARYRWRPRSEAPVLD